MFDVGSGELLLIIVAIIVLFGPQKLPEIAQMVGKGMKKFRDAQDEFKGQLNNIKDEINLSADGATPKPVRRSSNPSASVKRRHKDDESVINDVEEFYNHQGDKVPSEEEKAPAPKKASNSIENYQSISSGQPRQETPFKAEIESYPDYDPGI
jgi:TatA/E family protein of Tat protein translocase